MTVHVLPGRRPQTGRRIVTRRTLQWALGVVWILDGALQLQPFMFTKGFARQIILPSAAGQPVFVSDPVHWAGTLILAHPVLWDSVFALVQLAIGAGFLFQRTARAAILASVGWALGVWLLGEGLGGLAGGTSTFVSGAPGAVILYVVIGLAAWPQLGGQRRDLGGRGRALSTRLRALTSSSGDEAPARWVPAAWAIVWCLFALLQALPANSTGSALGSQVAATATGAPGWLAQAQHALARDFSHAGIGPVVAFVVIEVAIGLLGLASGRVRAAAAWVGIVVSLAVWVLGQGLGQIPTGMGTDPNSGLLVALLGAALLGRVGVTQQRPALSGTVRGEPSWEKRFGVA